MGGKPSKKKLVPNRPVPKQAPRGPAPVKMVPKPKRKMVPPDGGWGWMVIFGACLSLFFFPSMTVAFGVLFSEHISSLGSSATGFTVIGTGLITIWSFTALLIAPISELFGYRRVTITGGLLAFLTLLLTAYSTTLAAFALSYCIIGGIASALSTFIGYIIVPHYFDKRKGLANGIVCASSALGKIAMAPLVRLLLDCYGYVWACLLLAALSLHTCVAGMLYHPPEWHKIPDPNDDVEMLDDVGGQRGVGAVGEQQGGKQGTQRPRGKRDDEEDEDVIFVMPTTPTTTTQPQRVDDEVVLFSRGTTAPRRPEVEAVKEEELRLVKAGSVASLNGSMPTLVPPEQKIYGDDGDDGNESCLASCILVKPCLMLDYALLREPYFHLIAWPLGLLMAGYITFIYSLPDYVTSLGFSHYQGAFAISTFSACEVVFRLLFAALSDFSWFPAEVGYACGFVFSAVAIGVVTVVDSYAWILVCVGMLGVAQSLTSVLGIHVILKYIGLKRYAQCIGFLSLTNGFSIALAGFVVGAVRDYFGSFVITFFFITAIMSASAGVWVCWIGVQTSKKYRKLPFQTT